MPNPQSNNERLSAGFLFYSIVFLAQFCNLTAAQACLSAREDNYPFLKHIMTKRQGEVKLRLTDNSDGKQPQAVAEADGYPHKINAEIAPENLEKACSNNFSYINKFEHFNCDE